MLIEKHRIRYWNYCFLGTRHQDYVEQYGRQIQVFRTGTLHKLRHRCRIAYIIHPSFDWCPYWYTLDYQERCHSQEPSWLQPFQRCHVRKDFLYWQLVRIETWMVFQIHVTHRYLDHHVYKFRPNFLACLTRSRQIVSRLFHELGCYHVWRRGGYGYACSGH